MLPSFPLSTYWYSAPESHARIQQVNFNGQPCWHVWLPNGTIEEFGCRCAGGVHPYRWDLNLLKDGTFSYLLPDLLGSSTMALTSTGAVEGVQLFSPFGSTRYSDGTMPSPFSFTGQRLDSLTGLLYYGARYYDPVSGRFTTADDVENNTSGNDPYAYVHGNPESATDPSGHYMAALGGDGGVTAAIMNQMARPWRARILVTTGGRRPTRPPIPVIGMCTAIRVAIRRRRPLPPGTGRSQHRCMDHRHRHRGRHRDQQRSQNRQHLHRY
jgi:RHS repeat-associated protein